VTQPFTRFKHIFALVAITLTPLEILRSQEVTQIPIIDAPPQTPGLGAGFRINSSPYVESDEVTDLVPLYLYEGEYLYAHGTQFGAHLFRNDSFELNLDARYSFWKLDPDDSDGMFSTVEERRQTVEAGLEANLKKRWGQIRASWHADTLSRHGGHQFDLSYRYRFDVGNWMISPFVAAYWVDSDKANYYFGVSPDEANAALPTYAPGNAYNMEIGINTWYWLNDHVFLFGNFSALGLDEDIVNSPLVGEETVATIFAGAGYMFGDDNPKRYGNGKGISDWSWRVNYGYQAHSNIFPKLMSGQIRSSDIADNHIAGFTLGKLFQSGDRAEFWGKFAAYRHLEEPYQDDFWSFSAYVIAMGKGYVPWSEKLAFRYGFGLGVSYAQEVPYVEQVKQSNKGENTNRLLNYLEFMVDFPIDRLIETRYTKDCFVGMTVAHRSGIFATSDILGSVAGGSDWVTLSYECVR